MRVFEIGISGSDEYFGTEGFRYNHLDRKLPEEFEGPLINVLLAMETYKQGDFEVVCGFKLRTLEKDEPVWTTHYQVHLSLRKGALILDSSRIEFWLVKAGVRIQPIASPHIRWAYELWEKHTLESREEHLRRWLWEEIKKGFERNIARVNNRIAEKLIEIDDLKDERRRLTPFVRD